MHHPLQLDLLCRQQVRILGPRRMLRHSPQMQNSGMEVIQTDPRRSHLAQLAVQSGVLADTAIHAINEIEPIPYSATMPVIAVEPSVNTTSLSGGVVFSATTQVFTTTYRTTLASSSGTATSGEVIDVTQTSTRVTMAPVTPIAPGDAPGPTNAQVAGGAKHE